MREPLKVKRADIAAIIAATFPEYKGRRFKVQPMTYVSFQDLNWSGGTRSQYRACTLDGQATGNLDKWNQVWPGDNKAEGSSIDLLPGFAVVRHSIFCGQDTGLTVYVHPDSMPCFLESR